MLNMIAAIGNIWGSQAAKDAMLRQQKAAMDAYFAQRQMAVYMRQSLFWKGDRPDPLRFGATTTKRAKCPSCGSREWAPHAGKEVCAYCRSERV